MPRARGRVPDDGPAIAAILLAAGRSERMGAFKPLLPWGGSTLLEYQLEQLASVDEIAETIVVTGYAADRLTAIIDAAPKAHAAHNADYDAGKAGSIRRGLAAITGNPNAILLLAVDQPRPASLIRSLIETHRRAHAAITVPVYGGRRGHPLIFDRALLPELMGIDDASLGVRAVVERHASAVNAVPVADPMACLDLNTPEDAERGHRLLRGEP
jgi:molybdenum cofactor cytidylyltransferase